MLNIVMTTNKSQQRMSTSLKEPHSSAKGHKLIPISYWSTKDKNGRMFLTMMIRTQSVSAIVNCQ